MDKKINNLQYYKFSLYGFLKNLRFFDAFLILFLLDKGLTYTQIGGLYAIREVFINVFEVPSGIIADTFGRKNSLIGSLSVYILSFLIFHWASSYALFLIAFILYGIGDAFRSGTHKGMIMDYLRINQWEKFKINYYGHTRSWSQIGSALSSLMAGILIFLSGQYGNIFLYSIVPYLINLLLIISYPKELNFSPQKKKVKFNLTQTLKTLGLVVKQRTVIDVVSTSAIHSAYLKAVKDYIQPLMAHIAIALPVLIGVSQEKKSGLIIGIIYFFVYIFTSQASKMASLFTTPDKRRIALVTLLIGFLLGAFTGLMYHYEWWWVSLISFVGIYLIENLRKPILTGFVAEEVPPEILTSVISVQSLLKTIITALLAFVFGILADKLGIGLSFIILSLFLAISSLLLSYLLRAK
jgi:MFS family permease